MLNLICGLAGVTIVTLFLGGLAHSIWNSTGSLAFPVITVVVLIMVFVDFWDNLREENSKRT